MTREGLFAPPKIVTNSEFRFVVAEQARSRGVKATIILEPQRRDSAAAIAAAAELAMKMDPGAILLVVAAGHFIPDKGATPKVKSGESVARCSPGPRALADSIYRKRFTQYTPGTNRAVSAI